MANCSAVSGTLKCATQPKFDSTTAADSPPKKNPGPRPGCLSTQLNFRGKNSYLNITTHPLILGRPIFGSIT